MGRLIIIIRCLIFLQGRHAAIGRTMAEQAAGRWKCEFRQSRQTPRTHRCECWKPGTKKAPPKRGFFRLRTYPNRASN